MNIIRIMKSPNSRALPQGSSEISEPIPIFQAPLSTFYANRDRNYDLSGRPIPCEKMTREAIQASMIQNYELMPDLEKNNTIEPTMTICIPVALGVENSETFAQTLVNINNSATEGKFEVIVWANTSSKFASRDEAQIKFNALLEEISRHTYSRLTIRPVFQFLESPEVTISNIRGNYMEAVVLDCQKRGFGLDHPILWLDADTTFVSNGSLEAIASSVRNGKGIFVHANLQFSADWATGEKLDSLDFATRAFIVTEIHRRQGLRNRKEFDPPVGYMEESGLAFSLATYLRAGGVNRTDGMNESAHLDIKFQNNYLLQEVRFKNPQLLDELRSKYYYYLKSARIGTSGRNHFTYLSDLLGKKSTPQFRKGPVYELFTQRRHLAPIAGSDNSVSKSRMTRLLEGREIREDSKRKPLRDQYRGLIRQLIKKFFDE